jgi:hypothetical protein
MFERMALVRVRVIADSMASNASASLSPYFVSSSAGIIAEDHFPW